MRTSDRIMNHPKNYGYSEGFLFALHVLGSMGHRPAFDDIIAQLVSVAKGDLSLMPTPEEAIRTTEQEVGKEMPESLKAMFRRNLNERAGTDADHRASAIYMLRVMGVLPAETED